jgi:DNA repair exonuclease SbcCD nuclease subunit
MALSFVHTSDWHLGHVYRKLGPRAAESSRWRFDAVRRVFDLAVEKRADFVVVAGDVFDTDTPSPATMQAAVELLRDAPAPTYLISGNHDPCAEGSVWFHESFDGALKGVKNVHLARANEPLQVLGGDAVLFPCPVSAKHTREDATAWIPSAPRGSTSQARIGLAHGGWRGYWAQSEYSAENATLNEIDNRTAERCGLDYLALGDYHGFTPDNHPAAQLRTFYSGTPEVGASDDARAGHALFVEIEKPGDEPKVAPHSVGRLQCHDWGILMLQPGDGVALLQSRLEKIEKREDALIRAKIIGCVSENEWRDLQAWIGEVRDGVLGADIDTSKLLTEPTSRDFAALQLESPEQRLLEMLNAPLDSLNLIGVSDRDIVAQWSRDEEARRAARTLFYQLLRGDI